MSPKSTTTAPPIKPQKPRPDFPLFPHASGRWAKKVKGRLCYFGKWAEDSNGEKAIRLWAEQKDDLLAGRKPRTGPAGLSVRGLVNAFLVNKRRLMDSGELSPRSFADYYRTCERITGAFGVTRLVVDLAADDFEGLRASLSKTLGAVALSNEINRVRVLFKYAFDAGLIPQPVRFGPGFKKPSKKTLRLTRASRPARMFEGAELRTILGKAEVPLGAMILLGLNCGFGNADLATLPMRAVDLSAGWVDHPRPKTGIPRRCPLWPETVKAVFAALDKRPTPKEDADAGLLFITKYGQRWAHHTVQHPEKEGEKLKMRRDDPISKEYRKLLRDLGLHNHGRGFYALRHVFETIGGESRDQVAVDAIMGHARDDMASVYRERISDDRLQAVVDHIHAWLWPAKKADDMASETK